MKIKKYLYSRTFFIFFFLSTVSNTYFFMCVNLNRVLITYREFAIRNRIIYLIHTYTVLILLQSSKNIRKI